MSRSRLIESPRASARLETAARWLAEKPAGAPALIVAPTFEAGARLARAAQAADVPATFGRRRTTLARLALELALPELARRGLAPVGGLGVEALCARVVFRLTRASELGRLARVADRPGLPRALARTLRELRQAGVAPGALPPALADLDRVHRAYAGELGAAGLADRADIFEAAAAAARASDLPPLLLLDVPVEARREADLAAALAARSPDVLATLPAGDERTRRYLEEALEVAAEPAPVGQGGRGGPGPAAGPSLARLQAGLFRETPAGAAPGALGDDVTLLAAPGESREAVEIARGILREAERGVPFDRMAVLLHRPELYRAHLVEAFRRARVPALFSEGAVRPDPAGRALVALLRCKAERLSARAFVEYLSLGQVPDAAGDGAPPAAPPRADRFVAPADDLSPLALAPGDDRAGAGGGGTAAAAEPADDDLLAAAAAAEDAPVVAGTLRAPRRWERLIVDAAVIGGLDRWRRRLDGLERALDLERRALAADDDARARLRERDQADLRALRAFALPLLEAVDALPASASWGEWLEPLTALAARALRDPGRVLQVLSELEPMAPVGPIDLAEVEVALRRRLSDLRLPPAGASGGRVLVAALDEARGLAFDVVFVPGLAERIFPRKVVEDPLLLDDDRARIGGGRDLERNPDRIAAERLALRLAAGAATARAVLSFPTMDLERSRPRVPSFYALEAAHAVLGRLPGFEELGRDVERGGAPRLDWPAPERPADAVDEAEYDLAVLAPLVRDPARGRRGALRYLIDANPHLHRALRARFRRWMSSAWTPADGLVVAGDAGRAALAPHQLGARGYAPTALEAFAHCPYRFLLQAVLKLAPREVPEAIEDLDPLERGSLVHEVQRRTLARLAGDGLLPVTAGRLAAARARLESALDEVAREFRERLAPAIRRVFEDAVSALGADLREWLARLPGEAAAFVPERFELAFGLGPGHRALEGDPPDAADEFPEPVPLEGGIRLRGKIDLVERSADGACLRVTDHKTGRSDRVPEGAVIAGGKALQPVLYALALERLFPEVRVAGGRLYYCTATGGFVERYVALDAPARAAARLLAETIGGALERGFLPAAPDRGACEWCDYRPVCGPREEARTARKDGGAVVALKKLRGHP